MTKADIYKMLMSIHHWLPDQIAELNSFQQLIAADVLPKDVADDTITFSSLAEYNRWKAESGI